MQGHLRIPLVALLLVGASLLAAAPAVEAHNCIYRAPPGPDPEGCNAHDCRVEDELHLYHVVVHEGGDGSGIHGCGIIFHAGVDGQAETGYVCIKDVLPRCIQYQRVSPTHDLHA